MFLIPSKVFTTIITFVCAIGKTHTVSGTPSNPGLLPRMLDVVFNSVQDGKLLTDVKFKPKHYCGVSYPSQKELTSESEIKAAILAKVNSLKLL